MPCSVQFCENICIVLLKDTTPVFQVKKEIYIDLCFYHNKCNECNKSTKWSRKLCYNCDYAKYPK